MSGHCVAGENPVPVRARVWLIRKPNKAGDYLYRYNPYRSDDEILPAETRLALIVFQTQPGDGCDYLLISRCARCCNLMSKR